MVETVLSKNSNRILHSQLFYASNYEYIYDELGLLDKLINLYLLKNKYESESYIPDHFKGLVISHDEISKLLNNDDVAFSDNSENQELENELIDIENTIIAKRAAASSNGVFIPLYYLSRVFNLNRFEEKCIMIGLAVELERKYEKIFSYLQDDLTQKKPSVFLMLELLCKSVEEKYSARQYFEISSPLSRYLLVKPHRYPGDDVPLISRTLKLHDRVVNFMLGVNSIDARISNFAQLINPGETEGIPEFHGNMEIQLEKLADMYLKTRGQEESGNFVFYFYGPEGAGKLTCCTTLGSRLNTPLVVIDVQKLLASSEDAEELMLTAGLEAILRQAIICLKHFDSYKENIVFKTGSRRLIDELHMFTRLILITAESQYERCRTGNQSVFIDIELGIPGAVERKKYWEAISKEYRISQGVDFEHVSQSYDFTPGQIRMALEQARDNVLRKGASNDAICSTDIHTACRKLLQHNLDKLAQKVRPKCSWMDIVLPDEQISQLREICSQVKHRHKVLGTWGFDKKLSRGKGLCSMFSGSSGTGKTMAAEVIANELGMNLYKIDLSQIVSKYIGETEKNLKSIFFEAQKSRDIIFFDEADSIFGKRSEVKDAHDRYANIEVSFLLQQIEEYEGITILATNFSKNVDDAFLRRLQFVVDFPYPDEEHRRRIWQVTLPAELPLDSDLDFYATARDIKLAGGNIKNIALNAAFYAAEDGTSVGMKHVIRAAAREYQKLGRTWNGIQ